jgi:hypothetical protein
MSYRTLFLDSAVGDKGRTTELDAENHITNNPELIKQFLKIVKQLGGKSVAMKILSGFNPANCPLNNEISEAKTSVESVIKHLKDSGIKLKSNTKTSRGIELEFFKPAQAENAYEELKTLNLSFDFTLEHNFIIIKE